MKPVKLREWREHRGMTQKQLSEFSGIPQATISQAETGKRGPHPGTVRKLAEALGVTMEDMTAAPKASGPRLAQEWLEEVVGHSYLAMTDEEARHEQRRIAAVEVADQMRSWLRDEFVTIRAALDYEEVDPELASSLEAAARNFVQWQHELTRLVKRERATWDVDEEL